MFRDPPLDEKGPVVRQFIDTAIPLAGSRRALLAFAILASLLASPLPARGQPPEGDPPTEEPAADANRRAANIKWNEKTTLAEYNRVKKSRIREYDPLIKNATLSDADRKTILKQLENSIYGLTLEQNVDNHFRIADEIARSLELPGTSQTARDFVSESILKIVEPLLKDQPANVQYALVLLVSRLNARLADPVKGIPNQPYLPSQKLLMQVVASPQYPVPVKIMAVRGLDRILRDGEPPIVDCSTIGVTLAEALKQKIDDPLGRIWYRLKLVEALGVTRRYDETGKRPIIIDALGSVVVNRSDEWEVRCAAARSLTQLPLDGVTNNELVNYLVARLAYDLALAYNASDKQPPSKWRWSFAQLYLCYHSARAIDQNGKHWGLKHLNNPRGKAQIDQAYVLLLPILRPFVETMDMRPVDNARLAKLKEWLDANVPTDWKLHPQGETLKAAAMAAGVGGPVPAPPPAALGKQNP